MEYPKKVMKISELEKMGFPREFLEKAYRSKGQTFANKMDPTKPNSAIIFCMDGFEKWRLRQIRLQGTR